jgi:hypothetical protein
MPRRTASRVYTAPAAAPLDSTIEVHDQDARGAIVVLDRLQPAQPGRLSDKAVALVVNGEPRPSVLTRRAMLGTH